MERPLIAMISSPIEKQVKFVTYIVRVLLFASEFISTRLSYCPSFFKYIRVCALDHLSMRCICGEKCLYSTVPSWISPLSAAGPSGKTFRMNKAGGGKLFSLATSRPRPLPVRSRVTSTFS